MSKLFGANFGNYLIRGIDPIELPEPVLWLPQTPGWKILAVVAVLLTAYGCYRAGGRWWRNRYRRSALQRFKEIELAAEGDNLRAVAAMPRLLKATALHAYPRANVAALSGEAWLEFLDAHYSGPSFRSSIGRKLLNVAYRQLPQWQLPPEDAVILISMCRCWLRQHKAHGRRAAHA